MWKYVSRRIRDSVERTCNVLETRRTWTCGGEKSPLTNTSHHDETNCAPSQQLQLQKQCQQLNNFENDFQKDSRWNRSSSGKGNDNFKQRFDYECPVRKNVLGALTWSSAIVCGWYTSQLLCMRRRHLTNGWNSKCKYSKTILTPSHTFHSNVLSHWVLTAPEKQQQHYNSKASIWFENAFTREDTEKLVYQVSNDEAFGVISYDSNQSTNNDQQYAKVLLPLITFPHKTIDFEHLKYFFFSQLFLQRREQLMLTMQCMICYR